MKKYVLFFIMVMCIFPLMGKAITCSDEDIDTDRYQFERSVTGNVALNVEENFPSSQYTTSCCNHNGVYTCDVYSVIEEEQKTTSVNYCKGLKSTFTIIGHIVFIAKILIPILIIGLGMLDFFHAVIGSKDDEIKKSVKSLIFRCISGVVIFFLPAFIDLIFSWVNGWQENYENQYQECFQCIWNVNECTK